MFSKRLSIFALLLLSTNAMAVMPFTVSGDKIAAIFQSELLWRKLAGSVETIVFKGHQKDTSTFAVTTNEAKPIVSPDGVTTGHTLVPCLVLVQVTAKGDDLAPTWEVTKVDYSACPTVKQ